jgi:hypothetical protein
MDAIFQVRKAFAEADEDRTPEVCAEHELARHIQRFIHDLTPTSLFTITSGVLHLHAIFSGSDCRAI